MSSSASFGERVRSGIKTVAPKWAVDAARRAVLRRYDLASVVKRESRLKRWFSQHVLHLYYPASLVTRQSAFARGVSSRIRGEKPTLYHFDIHITDHCNLNCKGCGHFSNLCKPMFLDIESFDSDMSVMAAKLHVEQIYLLGGEPLLHPEIAAFVRRARVHFPETRIYVVTNGSLVMRQTDEFWQALAETRTILMCDAYPIGLPIEEINLKAGEAGVAVEWTDERSLFFKVPIDVTGSQDGADSFMRCSGINNCPMYKDGRLYPCAYASYIDAFKDRFDLDGLEVAEEDSISVRDNDGAAIMRFMTRPVPFCRHCDFDHFELYEWGRTERKLEEWTRS